MQQGRPAKRFPNGPRYYVFTLFSIRIYIRATNFTHNSYAQSTNAWILPLSGGALTQFLCTVFCPIQSLTLVWTF